MQIDYWPVARLGFHAGIKLRVARVIDLTFSYAHILQEDIVVAAPQHEEAATTYQRFAAGESINDINRIDKRIGVAPRGQDAPIAQEVSPGVADGSARLDQNLTKTVAGRPPWLVNAGRYRSGIDVVAAGINVHV
jgi:hypothetical protein